MTYPVPPRRKVVHVGPRHHDGIKQCAKCYGRPVSGTCTVCFEDGSREDWCCECAEPARCRLRARPLLRFVEG